MTSQQHVLLSLVQPGQRPFWEQPQYLYLGHGSCDIDEDGQTDYCENHTPIAASCVLEYRDDFYLLTARDTVKLGKSTHSYLASQRAKNPFGWSVLSTKVHVDECFSYVLAKLDLAKGMKEHMESLKRRAATFSGDEFLKVPEYEPTSMIGAEKARLWCDGRLQDLNPVETPHFNGDDENDKMSAWLPRGVESFSVNFGKDIGFGKIGTWIWDTADGRVKGVSIGAMDYENHKGKSRTFKMGFMILGRGMQNSILAVLARMSAGLFP